MTASKEFAPGLVIRGVTAPLRLSDFKLIAFDMDSTLINIECVDEIAEVAGKGPAVAAITEAAMRGEISDYKESLARRLALLAGTPVSALQRVYEHRLRLNHGALELLAYARWDGLKILLVSGGFTYFTERLKPRL
jgi:phosphoserine phosphatase